ncbi:hypothetical protein HDV00_002322 [Rhizophlyctis rosea]|nr:hypothetical protein HDV00_002322 [Rhizophlyctis rosea]
MGAIVEEQQRLFKMEENALKQRERQNKEMAEKEGAIATSDTIVASSLSEQPSERPRHEHSGKETTIVDSSVAAQFNTASVLSSSSKLKKNINSKVIVAKTPTVDSSARTQFDTTSVVSSLKAKKDRNSKSSMSKLSDGNSSDVSKDGGIYIFMEEHGERDQVDEDNEQARKTAEVDVMEEHGERARWTMMRRKEE